MIWEHMDIIGQISGIEAIAVIIALAIGMFFIFWFFENR